MSDIEYAKRLDEIVQKYEDREQMLNAIDFLKHRYIVEREDEKREVKQYV